MLNLFNPPKKKTAPVPKQRKLSAGTAFWDAHGDAIEETLGAQLAPGRLDSFEIKRVHHPEAHGLSVLPSTFDVSKPFPGSIVIKDAANKKKRIAVRILSDELAQWTLYVYGTATGKPKVICIAQDGLVLVLETITGSENYGPVH